MNVAWKKYRLGDLIDVKHGFAFKGEYFSDEPNENILLTPGNFQIGGGFKADKLKYYTGDVPEDYILKEGDIIVTMTDLSKQSDTLGYTAKVPKKNNQNYLHNQRLGLLKFKSNDVEKEFVYWVMRTAPYHSYIVGSATGSTVKHTSPSRITSYEFYAPENQEDQLFLASVLNSLEDKIEINHQINQTVEAIAEAIFKEWFLNFNFPGFDGELVNGLPKGWRRGSVLEVANLLSGGTPKTEVKEYWEGDIKWISARDITEYNGGFIVDTEKKITQEGLKNSAAKLLPVLTTVVSARGTVGNYCILPEEMTISQSNYGLKSKVPDKDFFVFLLVKSMIDMMQQYSYGTVFDTITTKTFKEIEVILPDENVALEFNVIVKPLFEKILLNTTATQALKSVRDSLLPKLMLGKIEIKT